MTPVCLGIQLCDEVIEDKQSNKKSLIGLFNNINVRSFPALHSRMCILVSLTEVRGKMPIELSIVYADSPQDKPLLKLKGSIEATDPLVVHELVFRFQGLPLLKAGKCLIQLTSNGTPLQDRPFNIIQLSASPGNQG